MSARTGTRRVALRLRTGSHEVTLIHKLWWGHLLHSLEHLHVGYHRGLLASLSGGVCTLSSRVLELRSDHLLVHSKLLLLHIHGVLHHLHVLFLGHWFIRSGGTWHLHHWHLSAHWGHHTHVHGRHHLSLSILGCFGLGRSLLVFRCFLLRFSLFD